MNGVAFLSVVASLSNLHQSESQGFQPIVHYVLTPVEIFRIPRPDYQPQIQVVPTEDLGPLLLNHPSNEYFRNLLINPVTYDSIDVPRGLVAPTPVLDRPTPAVPCSETPAVKAAAVKTLSDDVDILNTTSSEASNTTEGMIARIIDDGMDTSNGTDAEEEEDDGRIEATTPRPEGEQRPLNKTARMVSRRSPAPATPLRVPPHVRGHAHHPRYSNAQYKHHRRPTQRSVDHHSSFDDEDEDEDYGHNSAYSESESYEEDSDDENNDHDLHHDTQDDNDIPGHHDIHDNHDIDEDEIHVNDDLPEEDIHDTPHKSHPLRNDRFLDDHDILGDLGDDLFRFDHKNTDHKVLDYKRTDKTVRPHH